MAFPKRLSYWHKFIDWFSETQAYWYFPKGRVVNSEDIIEAFRILVKYEGEVWREAQGAFLDDLSNAALFNRRAQNQNIGDRTAMARMWKTVFSTLGFAWVEDSDKVAITSAGEEFRNTNNPMNTIEKQIQKYQIYNPTLRRNIFKEIKLRPHIFLLDVLLHSEYYITDKEYIMFVSRARQHNEIDMILEFITYWRSLSERDQETIYQEATKSVQNLSGRRSSLVNTIDLNMSYALAFLTCCSYLDRAEQGDTAVRLKASGKFMAEKIVRKYLSESVFVDYRNAKDWFSYYGDPNKLPTEDEAIDYYVDTSQTDKLIEVSSAEFTRDAQINEKLLEDFLENNLNALEEGLTLVGRQYATITGPIDLLCKDKNDNFVVVELKKGRASDRVVGQTLRYIGFVKQDMLDSSEQIVRGIIVAREIDKKLEMAVSAISGVDISLKTFDASITINSELPL